jgi:hypothetical protein
MRINNTGHYEYCRWAVKHDRQQGTNIREQDPIIWFQQGMNWIRKAMCDGETVTGCSECDLVDKHHKVSGRQRQRLKIGIDNNNIQKSLLSTPWMDDFIHSYQHDGHSDLIPQDWQIDLGNFCNSACIFCDPHSSSRLAAEFKRLDFIDQLPPRAWCHDPDQLARFVTVLEKISSIAYLHFIGGETLITPAFKIILQALVNTGLCQRVSIGFTTNLTVWDQSIVDLLTKFKQVNLGMSVECLHPLNDYVRYGSKIHDAVSIMQQWISVAQDNKWLTQLRITPTMLSVWHFDTVYYFAAENNIAVESCNFLNDPVFLRPSVLPRVFRDKVIIKLHNFLQGWTAIPDDRIINTRNPHTIQSQIREDAVSYINYLEKQPDESYRLPDLVKYLRSLEQIRGNSILDYLPEYEGIFRSAGY